MNKPIEFASYIFDHEGGLVVIDDSDMVHMEYDNIYDADEFASNLANEQNAPVYIFKVRIGLIDLDHPFATFFPDKIS